VAENGGAALAESAAVVVEEAVTGGADAASDADLDAVETEPGDGSPAPKKRTRRGTRGGRSRRKPAAEANGGGAGEASEPGRSDVPIADVPAADAVAPEGYVPMSEWLDDFDRR
jgi:hypothetical protein